VIIVIGAGWALIVCGGFVVSTLITIVKVITYFDNTFEANGNDSGYGVNRYSRMINKRLAPFLILQYLLYYTFIVSFTTIVFKKHVV
jgi:hypothetical protein